MSNTEQCQIDGEDVTKVTLEVYHVGKSGKRFVEISPDTPWEKVFELVGGEGKKVTSSNEDVRSKEGTVGSASEEERQVVVGLDQGKAGS